MARRTGGRLRAAVAGGALLTAAVLALPAAGQAAARPDDPPAGPDVPLTELLTRLKTSYLRTETATESYDRAAEAAARQRADAERMDRQLADQRVVVAAARDELGLMARQMYRDGGVSPFLSMLTGRTPQDFFAQRHTLQRAAGRQRDVLGELTRSEARLKALNATAQRALDAARHTRDVLAARKKQVETGLRQVEATLAGLTGAQSEALRTLEERGDAEAQTDFLDSRALGDDPAGRAPSAPGDRAVGYAFAQLGKPYVWGAQGPASFDCSGLTSQAWAHAGIAVPRTSQGQWAALKHVPLRRLRPGDLVVYFKNATHVALYVGDGLVVQAPRPGATVRVSPIAADPILGAVRPDPGRQPLKDYRPRSVPRGHGGR
ncbi:C40 family peptidase [Actinacidiphila sp. ITFR-21]|uniref:C40 family peptidase n=1 Tax=Actinacidiphila sp. ITFR-21 TaxID=3075199 RepID=UPI00288B3C52|nr:C40 family peptidase [Streptomyces sp. ITFR-21]WNI17958.1 C40 family peptidase [Streptomyces sp. ITFR-21]